jgi:hypothetical protein
MPNRLLVAYEDGHSVATMERTYAAWTRGAKPEDVELIKQAMAVGRRPTMEETTAIVAVGIPTRLLSPQKLPLRCH